MLGLRSSRHISRAQSDRSRPELVRVGNPKAPTADRVKKLTWAIDVEPKEIGEAFVLKNHPKFNPFGAVTTSGLCAEWLLSAPPGTIAKLKMGMDFQDLDPAGQRLMANLCADISGLHDRMVSGQSVHVQLSLEPMVYLNTGEVSDVFSVGPSNYTYDEKLHALPSRPQVAESPETVIARVGPTLDFGDGQMVMLEELLSRLRKAFKRDIVVDERLLGQSAFMRGVFTADEFEKVLVELFTTQKPDPIDWSRKNRWLALRDVLTPLMDGVGNPGGIAASEFADQKSKSIADLLAAYPNMKTQLNAWEKFNPNGGKLLFGVAFRMRAPGMSESINGQSRINGVAVKTYEPNSRSFIMTP
jgi:hypothetical protein